MVVSLKIISFVFMIVSLVLLYPHMNQQAIETFITEYGSLAPLVFIILCAIKPLVLFLPSCGLTVIAGLLFGYIWGTVYVAVGGALSTIIGFYFARWYGRDAMKKLIEGNDLLKKLACKSNKNPRTTILYMRIFNVPWDLVSYWAGLIGIRFKDFYIASLVTLIPVSFIYTYFGSTILSPKSAGFWVSLLVIISLGALPHIYKRLGGEKCRK